MESQNKFWPLLVVNKNMVFIFRRIRHPIFQQEAYINCYIFDRTENICN